MNGNVYNYIAENSNKSATNSSLLIQICNRIDAKLNDLSVKITDLEEVKEQLNKLKIDVASLKDEKEA